MTTPYNSFTPLDRFLSKEYTLPISAMCEVYAEDLDFFNGRKDLSHFDLGGLLSKVSSAATSVQNIATTVKGITATGGPGAPPLNSQVYQTQPAGTLAPSKDSFVNWNTTTKVAVIGGAVLLLAALVVVIIKKRNG